MTMNIPEKDSNSWPPKRVLCVGAVVLQGKKVLLVRQAQGESLAGQWSIPWGIIEQDEYPSAAAERETREEGGITAEVEGLLGIQNLAWESSVAIIYLCRHIDGAPQPDGAETDKAAYFSLNEMEALKEPIEPWCEWLAKRVLRGEYTLIHQTLDSPYQPYPTFL